MIKVHHVRVNRCTSMAGVLQRNAMCSCLGSTANKYTAGHTLVSSSGDSELYSANVIQSAQLHTPTEETKHPKDE